MFDLILEGPVAFTITTIAEHPVRAGSGWVRPLLRYADARDDLSAHGLGELDSGHAHATRRAIDEHQVTGSDFTDDLQRVIRRKKVAADVGALRQRNVVGCLPHGTRVGLDDLGHRADAHLRDHSVTHPQALDAFTDLENRSRQVHAGHIREGWSYLVEALSLKRIRVLDSDIM